MISIFTNVQVVSDTQDTNALYEALISEMAQGSVQALESLYAHTKSAVYGYALSIVRQKQTAEDIMQDAYVKLYQSAVAYQPQGKPMAWILTITRNLALMKLRGNKDIPVADEVLSLGSTAFSDQSDDRMVLDMALNTLAREERQIIILHVVGGLKHREIAEMLSIPLSTVLSKYRRSLTKLENLLRRGRK